MSKIIDSSAKLISSVFFTGYIPITSGTFGSLIIVVLFYIFPGFFVTLNLAVLLLFLVIIGIWSATVCEKFWGIDSKKVVIDEVAGMVLTIMFLPLNYKILWTGFFLFRIFDIFKPQPAKAAERLPAGWGVMTDDIVAGIYSNIVLQIIVFTTPWLK